MEQTRTSTLNRQQATALHSNVAGISKFVENFDLSTVSTSVKDFCFRDSLLSSKIVSIQAKWSGLTGTLDGTIDLIQSHDGEDDSWDTCDCLSTMNLVADSRTLEKADFGSQFSGIRYTKNGITGGSLTLTIIAKD